MRDRLTNRADLCHEKFPFLSLARDGFERQVYIIKHKLNISFNFSFRSTSFETAARYDRNESARLARLM